MIADARYCCSLPRRLARVREHNAALPGQALNGIDYIEIASVDQRTLYVWCLQPAMALTPAHCQIDGGARITGIEVIGVLASAAADPQNQDYRLRLTVSSAGDFSDYTLRLVDPSAPDQPAPGFDPRLAQIDFSFKAQCPSDFDCASTPDCGEVPPPVPAIDYLAKDYASFSELMLDRLGVLMPGFVERNPADLQLALVELLAYAGDHLSYYQDAVGTEAYLGTARSRISLRRHARLLDYAMHDGCNARAWVAIEVDRNVAPIPAGTALLTRGEAAGAALASADLARQRDVDTLVFETLHALTPTPQNGSVRFYTWSDEACWLPARSTHATLTDQGQTLAAGDVLIFEEVISPETGLAQDADASRRWAIRLTSVVSTKDPLTGDALLEVTWGDSDALPFALCLSAQIGDALVVTPDISIARGNVVLADHGLTRQGVKLVPPLVPDGGDYRPLLPDTGIAFAVPFDALALAKLPANGALVQDPRAALPAGAALVGETIWLPQRDLLASNRFSTEFVLETENDGGARLRFGDGRNGLAPSPGEQLLASYRLGGGARGNVGAEAITRIVTDDATLAAAVKRVRNPLPAAGGQDPESAEQVRQYAPQAFRVQERAVTEDDFARIAERYPGVQRAVARLRWTGSWYTVYISVDRRGGRSAVFDATFNDGLRAYVERFRLAGYDLEIRDPVYVPLDIALQVCVQPDRYAADVEAALLLRFGTTTYAGRPAFFNPDEFSFGEPLYLSRLVAAAVGVPGVASVKVTTFQRWGRTANGELAAEVIRTAPLEVVRLDNDPNFPENGRIVFDMLGGL
jgi:hypothetical protein